MSGARFHLRLRHGQLRRAAVVGLAFVVVVTAACWLPMVRGDDRAADPQAAAELAARKRILANWQARQDRIKSFYVAWKPGPNDRPARLSIDGLAGVHELWMASDGRFRDEVSSFAFGRPLTVGRYERAFDGKYLRTLWTPLITSPDGTLGNLRFGRVPSGMVFALEDLSQRRRHSPDSVGMLAFRPLQSRYGDWTLESSRVTSQNAVVDRRHYVKIQKTDAESGISEACWVDPRRDDLVIHFAREYASGSEEWISLAYKQDPRHGWMLTGWQDEFRDIGVRGMRKTMNEAIVTECKIDDDFRPGIFQIKFPAGAIVRDEDAERDFFVRRDGSQRTIDRSQLGKSIKYEQLVNEDTTRAATH